jgi:hypothetical protein
VRPALALGILTILAGPLPAQGGRSGCAMPDTTAAWYRRQREWADDSKHDWSNDSLRTALLRAAGLDAQRPLEPQMGWSIAGRAAAAPAGDAAPVLALLRSLAHDRQSPWPTKSVVGAAGVRALWLIAKGDSALAPTVLHRMMEAGPDESLPADVAVLEDALRLRAGRKQLYGTQLIGSGGNALAPAAIEDSAHVDLRRGAAWLPPLDQALCAAGTLSR